MLRQLLYSDCYILGFFTTIINYKKNKIMNLLDVFLIGTAGYIIGVLRERWVYLCKTGKHLQDLKKE